MANGESLRHRPRSDRRALLIDTNAIIDVSRGARNPEDIAGAFVSSIVLHELFGICDTDSWKNAFYPRPRPHRAPLVVSTSLRFHALDKKHLEHRNGDRLQFHGDSIFPSHSMFSHAWTTKLTNTWGYEALAAQATIVMPDRKRSFQHVAKTLTESQLSSLPLTQEIVDASMEIVQKSGSRHQVKHRKRNSLNDLLLIGQARWTDMRIRTSDTLMREIANGQEGWRCVSDHEQRPWFEISPPTVGSDRTTTKDRVERYLNAAWRSTRNFDRTQDR